MTEPTTPDFPSAQTAATSVADRGRVSARAFFLGLVLSAGMAWINNWFATIYNAHLLGGIQMPFGAIFVLMVFVLGINWPLRMLNRSPAFARIAPAFSPVELITIYAMLMFAALVSTPGCDNQWMTIGAGLFYFGSRENGWADLFYSHIPSWFAPGWDGATFQREVAEKMYLGGVGFFQIPWHAWAAMLIAWTIFLVLIYATLFFTALLFRKQWIENESLSYPLLQLPLQMIETEGGQASATPFWSNTTMWVGLGMALAIHFLKGMNSYYPEWPVFPVNYYGTVGIDFTEQPWNAMVGLRAKVYLGGIGIAYLLTREVSFSFWFFYLFAGLQLVLATMLGFPSVGLPKAGIMGKPSFLIFESIGAWVMMAAILVWTAREHILTVFRSALAPRSAARALNEPFSARFIVFGLLLSCAGLLVWSWFAQINLLFALVFFGIFLMTSIVLTRLVIEGGLMFPQPTFYALEWMTSGMFGAGALGAGTITKLSFLQPTILLDMRTNVLPAFSHVFKIADELNLDRPNTRRLVWSVVTALLVSVVVTLVASLTALYSNGGLAGYTWFSQDAPQATWSGAATMIGSQPQFEILNVAWMGVGALGLGLLVLARSRFVWFPLHPLGFLVAAGFPLSELWFSFFVGWLVKSLVMKYGSTEGYVKLRPFMLGLILGNAAAMVFWMIVGLFTGQQTAYWPA